MSAWARVKTADLASRGGWWLLHLQSDCQTGAVGTEAWEKSKGWEWCGCLVSPFSQLSASEISWWNPELSDSKRTVCRKFPGDLQDPQCLEQKVLSPGHKLLGAARTALPFHHLGDLIWLLERVCFSPEQIPLLQAPFISLLPKICRQPGWGGRTRSRAVMPFLVWKGDQAQRCKWTSAPSGAEMLFLLLVYSLLSDSSSFPFPFVLELNSSRMSQGENSLPGQQTQNYSSAQNVLRLTASWFIMSCLI